MRLASAMAAMAMVVAGCGGSTPGSGLNGAVRGQRPYTVSRVESPEPAASGRWGGRVASAAVAGQGGDLDGDGTTDLFVGQPRYSTSATRNAGRVTAISGKTGKVIYAIDPPEPQADAKFGFYTAAVGDVDGDAKSDVAVGTDAQNADGNTGQGAAWVFSGATGKLLYRLDNPQPQADARFGSRIAAAGDVTGDGTPDVSWALLPTTFRRGAVSRSRDRRTATRTRDRRSSSTVAPAPWCGPSTCPPAPSRRRRAAVVGAAA